MKSATYAKTFGAYVSKPWTSVGNYVTDD